MATHCSVAIVRDASEDTHKYFNGTGHEFFCTDDTGLAVILSKSLASNYS